jgi:hypothetical protein
VLSHFAIVFNHFATMLGHFMILSAILEILSGILLQYSWGRRQLAARSRGVQAGGGSGEGAQLNHAWASDGWLGRWLDN